MVKIVTRGALKKASDKWRLSYWIVFFFPLPLQWAELHFRVFWRFKFEFGPLALSRKWLPTTTFGWRRRRGASGGGGVAVGGGSGMPKRKHRRGKNPRCSPRRPRTIIRSGNSICQRVQEQRWRGINDRIAEPSWFVRAPCSFRTTRTAS